ncbi:hypothetical protein BKK42_10400 [Bacillus cereus]|nr:hypothetical protein BKK42_10400 [Bacillus cereus]
MKVPEMVIGLVEVGKKYEITTFDEKYGHASYKCIVKKKTDGMILIEVIEGYVCNFWINWTELDTIEEMK